MKKLLTLLLVCFLAGCAGNTTKVDTKPDDRYLDMIDLIWAQESYLTKSNYYDISAEIAKIDNGYRFYVVVDNARIAVYDVEVLVVEEGVDYRKTMAANVGIFEESEYSMIPNQANTEKGYVSGVAASGVTADSSSTFYVLVQWKSADRSTTSREYFRFDVSYNGD